jgi:hypothetical protein
MSAADFVWGLCLGFPRDQREKRRLMVLQVAADDSGSEPQQPVFVLAGFCAQASVWADFSDAWDEALKLPPRLEYFKMAEANALREQFTPEKGWNEEKRNQRLDILIEIISAHLPLAVCGSMPNSGFSRHMGSLLLPRRLHTSDHPYAMLLFQLALSIAHLAGQIGVKERIEFILDEQSGISDEAPLWWPFLRKTVRQAGSHDSPHFYWSTSSVNPARFPTAC